MFAFADNISPHFVIFCNSCPKHGCFVFVSYWIVSAGSYSFIGHEEHVCCIQQAILQPITLYFPFLLAHNIALYAESFQLKNEGTFNHQAIVYEPWNKNILSPSVTHTGLNFYLSSKHWHRLLFSVEGMSPPELGSITFSQGSDLPHLLLA